MRKQGRVIGLIGLCIALPSPLDALASADRCTQPPAGWQSLFNGKNARGWHWSQSTIHGRSARAVAKDCTLILEHNPYGQGGLLLSDGTYRNFELMLEAKPDAHANSGIFFRTTPGGSGYQVELERPGATTGALIGENLVLSERRFIGETRKVGDLWKDGEWNRMRIRVEGDAPRVTVWINDEKLYELQLAKNDLPAAPIGHIGLQLHLGISLAQGPGGPIVFGNPDTVQRFRNIFIRKLP